MKISRVTDTLSISGQPAAADMLFLQDLGFQRLINLRPDGEDSEQLGNERERALAAQSGLSYSFIPVTGPTITDADVRAFQAATRMGGEPVLAHCKSGTRALTLHVLGEALDGRMQGEEIAAFGQSLGYDLSGAARWLERRSSLKPEVRGFFEPRTGSVQYVVADPQTGACAIIDPVLDFDEKSGSTATKTADALLAYVREKGYTVAWILDTHPHADHFSAARYLHEKTGAPTAIGAHVVDVQRLWKDIYNWPEFAADGSQWDRLFADGETFRIGSLDAQVMFSPGHTLASITYVIGDAAFIHDTLFMPDSGTARSDFPGGDAQALWRSIERILALPDETRLFTGHDYQPGGRVPRWESTVGEQKRSNLHVAGASEQSFVEMRTTRDGTLPMPKLILHALQVNIRGGRLPEAESNGIRYLKIPLDALDGAAW